LHDRLIEEVLRDLPVPLAPRSLVSLTRLGRFRRPRPFGGGTFPAEKRDCVLVCAVAATTLWVTASDSRVETSRLPDSAWTRFLFAPCRSAPDSCRCPVMTPARGAGDLACPAISRLKGRAAPAATFLSPVARDYPSCALGGFFRPPGSFNPEAGRSYPEGYGCYCADQNANANPGGKTKSAPAKRPRPLENGRGAQGRRDCGERAGQANPVKPPRLGRWCKTPSPNCKPNAA
jgi:hypothetical protein